MDLVNPPSSEAGPTDSGGGQPLLESGESSVPLLVEIQASEDIDATGYKWQDVVDPSIRRSSLCRTPPMAKKIMEKTLNPVIQRSGSIDSIFKDLEKVTKIGLGSVGSSNASSVKRGREEDSEGEIELKDLKELIDKLMKSSKVLIQRIQEIPNTKLEIKKAAREINSQIEILNRKQREWEEFPARTKTRVIIKKTSSVGTQTTGTEIDREREAVQLAKEIRSTLETQHNFDDLSKVIDETWPNEVYKATLVESGNPAYTKIDEDLAILLDPSIKSEDKTLGPITNRFPEIVGLIDEGLEEGQIEFLKNNTEVISSKGKRGEKRNTLLIIPYKMNEEGITDVRTLYDIMVKFKNEADVLASKNIKVAVLGNINLDYVRKCMEFSFHNTGTKITLLIPRGIKMKSGLVETEELRRKKPTTRKLIVSSEGETYADLLKKVKENIDLDEVGVKIKALKKTSKGDLLLEVEGGKENAATLKNAIKSKTENMEVIVKPNDLVVHITDIDASINEEDLKRDLKKNKKGITDENIRVLSLRTNNNGNQTASVSLDKEIATELINRGKVKIGWVMCRIRQRIHIVRCLRCLQFGHRANQCKDENKTEKCFRCGESGHKVKDCNNAPFCTTCKVADHRADQTKCPHFRKLLKEQTRSSAIVGKKRHHSSKSVTD